MQATRAFAPKANLNALSLERTICAFCARIKSRRLYAVQKQIKDGRNRFLFEMATVTGKTLTPAAVIKMFLKSGNVKTILFPVDRLELGDQA